MSKFDTLIQRLQRHKELADTYRFAIEAVDEAYINAANIAASYKIDPHTCANPKAELDAKSKEINRRINIVAEAILNRSTLGKRPHCAGNEDEHGAAHTSPSGRGRKRSASGEGYPDDIPF